MSYYIFLAEGFEMIEALTVVDMLRRAKMEIYTVSVSETEMVTSSHNVTVKADMRFEDVDFAGADMLILPGGMPGTKHLGEHKGLTEQLLRFHQEGRKLAAICAAPSVLGELGILKGKRATCYPGFEDKLAGAEFVKAPAVVDGNIITGRGMGAAIDFASAIITDAMGEAKAQEIQAGIMYQETKER